MNALEPNQRNHCLILLLYIAELRVSEACIPRKNGGQLTIVGKGQKEWVIVLKADMWAELMSLRAVTPGPDVFVLRGNGRGTNRHISLSQVQHLVRLAAIRAGINKPVSPHWLRHGHANIALYRGASIDLVRDTLGYGSVAVTDKYLHAKPEHSSSEYL